MIKKIILFFAIFIASINSLISEIIKYKVISDTFYSDGDIEFTNPIKKDTTVIWKSDNRVYISYNDDETFIENFLMSVEYDNETIYMLSTDLQVIDTEKIINKKNLLRIIPDYYLEVLYKKDSNLIFENQPLWKERRQRMENEPFPFEDSFQPESYYISNPVILFSLHNYYMVKNVRKSNNNFEIDLLHYSSDVIDYYGKTEDVFSEVYNKFRSNSNIKLLIQNDGDFFDLWINTKENYIGRYIVASDSLCNQIINLVRSNNCDLSKIIWPRHADGSCDYEDGGKSAAESSVRKPAPATEHAESAEEAAFPEVAESETSNEETDTPSKESADIANAPATERAGAKQNAALPILPIAAGVAALAVLLAVAVLAAKKKKVNIMTDVYKLIADMICNSIDDKWEKAVVEIESSPWQMLSTSAYYFKDGHKNAFGLIDDNQDEDLGENIFELQESMQSKDKWNRAVYTLERNGHFDMEFIWDQALQDEWDKA